MKRQDITIEEVQFNKRVNKHTIKSVLDGAINLCDKVLNSNNSKCESTNTKSAEQGKTPYTMQTKD